MEHASGSGEAEPGGDSGPGNPLLTGAAVPRFDLVRPEHVEPAVDSALREARQWLNQVDQKCSTWNTVVVPVEGACQAVARVWNPVRQLHAVASSPGFREAHDRALPAVTRFRTELTQDTRLHAAYRRLKDDGGDGLDSGQHKVVDDALRDFADAGADLDDAARAELADIEERLARLHTTFEEHVLDATQAWSLRIEDPGRLRGIDADLCARAAAAAEASGSSGWLLRLDPPLVQAVMTTAQDRALRETVHRAWSTRASDQDDGAAGRDNGPVMSEIVALRQRKAALLGYPNYAELVLSRRMVGSAAEARTFLDRLADRALPAGRAELDVLKRFAAADLGIEHLEPWDIPYATELLRERCYGISDARLRAYFPLDRVLEGLFTITRRLFDVRFEHRPDAAVWHPDVRAYAVYGARGEPCGQLYLDLHARPGKRAGAWVGECRARMNLGYGLRQAPAAFLNCNFASPTDAATVPRLGHSEVVTLFHEMGHALHQLLTRVNVPSHAGLNGVEWDAVELPSQLLEQWCWDADALGIVAAHAETGEPLPDETRVRIAESRTHMPALGMLRQLEFALFDLRLHVESRGSSAHEIQVVLDDVRAAVALVRPPAWNRFAHAFTHVFAGAYAAGYYSYKWAEVLAADAREAFEAEGSLSAGIGTRFREAVLAQGGEQPALACFRAFRGRDPDPDALLRRAGLAA